MHSLLSGSALALAVFSLAGASAGCGRSGGGPDCKAVGAAYATLLQREIEKEGSSANATADETAQALSLIPIVKEKMVEECDGKKWSPTTRACVVDAKDQDELERCRTQTEPTEDETPEPSEDKAPVPAGAPAKTEPAPAPSEPVPAAP